MSLHSCIPTRLDTSSTDQHISLLLQRFVSTSHSRWLQLCTKAHFGNLYPSCMGRTSVQVASRRSLHSGIPTRLDTSSTDQHISLLLQRLVSTSHSRWLQLCTKAHFGNLCPSCMSRTLRMEASRTSFRYCMTIQPGIRHIHQRSSLQCLGVRCISSAHS